MLAGSCAGAGKDNAINCAAGHHMAEAGWLTTNAVRDSITHWWVASPQQQNPGYYYWYASALRRNYDKDGNTSILRQVVPAYVQQHLRYANGTLPDRGAAFNEDADCLWNLPGNEGQEGSLSGPGCRPLVQSMMYGESSSLAVLCAAIGDSACAAQMQAEAERWQRRVLRLWNPALDSFDTLRLGDPPPPPPPPPPPSPHPHPHPGPPPPVPAGWALLPSHNETFCCDQSACTDGGSTFLFSGSATVAECAAKCLADARCNFITCATGDRCMNSEYCNTTGPWQNTAETVRTYHKPSLQLQAAAPPSPPPPGPPPTMAGVRELASLSSPWFFQAVPQENASSYAASWLSAFDPEGLGGPFGLRTAEKRHPGYSCSAGCCSWAGHYWPFESSKAVTAAIHVLNHYADTVDTLDKRKFWHLLWQYTASHTPAWGVMNGVGNNGRKGTACYANLTAASQTARWLEPGLGLGDYWVAENGCADATIPTDAGSIPGPAWTDDATLGYRYNHASFMDLVLSGVVGLVPSANGTLVVNPLVPADVLPWWAADGMLLHGRVISVLFDADGKHYNKGAGLQVLVDGVKAASAPTLSKLVVNLS
eukprot:COSAG06_NODE_406_length_16115_cov_38.420142_4_plen_594_part_00